MTAPVPDKEALRRALMESASTDGLDGAARDRVARSLGLTVGTWGTAGAAARAAARGRGWWKVLLGTLGTGLAVTVFLLASHRGAPAVAPPARPAHPAAPPSASAATATTPDIPTLAVTDLPVVPRPPVVSSRAVKRGDGDSVAEQLAALDAIRRELAGVQPAAALRDLDSFDAKYAASPFADEAAVLRIEALEASGDRSAARQRGRAFLAASPGSPYAKRVRSLVGEDTATSPDAG